MHYSNNGFRSYVNKVHAEYSFRPTKWFLVKLLLVLPVLLFQTIKDAGIELFFLLIFWLVIAKMSQGRRAGWCRQGSRTGAGERARL